jgi:hypothetical protein
MSEDENTGPAIPRFSEMFHFADDSDLNEHARELRAEAFAYGFNLDVRVFPGPIPPSKEAQLGEGITPLPKRAREILHELNTKHYLNEYEAVNAERRRRGQKPFGDAKKLAKFQADFEKAYYGKFRHSEKARRIIDLVRAWHGRQITEQWNKPEDQWENRIRLVLLSPVLNAVRENVDSEFFKLLAGAVQMLSNRIYSSKDKTIGTGDTFRDKRLLEYAVGIAGTAAHTPHEINVLFDPAFSKLPEELQHAKDKKLHERLHRLGPIIPHKDEPRGKASPKYGKVLNLPPKRRKKGKF